MWLDRIWKESWQYQVNMSLKQAFIVKCQILNDKSEKWNQEKLNTLSKKGRNVENALAQSEVKGAVVDQLNNLEDIEEEAAN